MRTLAFDGLGNDEVETVRVFSDVAGGEPTLGVKKALELLEGRNYQGAAVILEGLVRWEPSPEHHGLLGTAYLLVEDYDAAKQHLTLAAEIPQDAEWAGKLRKAIANAIRAGSMPTSI